MVNTRFCECAGTCRDLYGKQSLWSCLFPLCGPYGERKPIKLRILHKPYAVLSPWLYLLPFALPRMRMDLNGDKSPRLRPCVIPYGKHKPAILLLTHYMPTHAHDVYLLLLCARHMHLAPLSFTSARCRMCTHYISSGATPYTYMLTQAFLSRPRYPCRHKREGTYATFSFPITFILYLCTFITHIAYSTAKIHHIRPSNLF